MREKHKILQSITTIGITERTVARAGGPWATIPASGHLSIQPLALAKVGGAGGIAGGYHCVIGKSVVGDNPNDGGGDGAVSQVDGVIDCNYDVDGESVEGTQGYWEVPIQSHELAYV